MKFKLPEGCASASHAGVALLPDRDGVVVVHPDAAAALAAHAIVPLVPQVPKPDAAKAKRE